MKFHTLNRAPDEVLALVAPLHHAQNAVRLRVLEARLVVGAHILRHICLVYLRVRAFWSLLPLKHCAGVSKLRMSGGL